MAKVIWHKAASPQHTDGSIVFARRRQCAPPSNRLYMVHGPTTYTQHLKLHLDRFSRLCTAHGRGYLYSTIGAPSLLPQNSPFASGISTLSNTWLFGPIQLTLQTASRSIQPFLQGLRSWQTDTQTSRPAYFVSVKIGPIYVRSTAVRPNNTA